MLEPRHSAAAWSRRRRPESLRRLLCSAPPLGFPGANRLAAWERVRGPHHAAAIAPPRGRRRSPPAAGLAAPPALRAAPRAMARLAWPRPLSVLCRWPVGPTGQGLWGVYLFC